MEELARKLTEVANQMTVIGTEMTYYGGFDEQMVRHGYEMIGAAVVALGWTEEIAKAKDRAERTAEPQNIAER